MVWNSKNELHEEGDYFGQKPEQQYSNQVTSFVEDNHHDL